MDSFEFEVDGYKFRVSSNDGHAYTCIEEFRDGKWKYLSDHTFVTTHAFRALLANRAELVARARVAAEDAEKMRALEQHVIELKGHAHKCDCERWLAGEEIDEDGDHSYQYTEGVACTCGLDKLLPPAAAQEGGEV